MLTKEDKILIKKCLGIKKVRDETSVQSTIQSGM